MVDKEKTKLKKSLSSIEGVTQQDIDNILDLLNQCEPEIDAFVKLINFATKGKIEVYLNYDLEMDLSSNLYEVWAKQAAWADGSLPWQIEEDCLLNGKCYLNVKQPAGYNIAQFIGEKHFGNLGIDTYDDASKVHPEIKKHITNFVEARDVLVKKLEINMKKMGFDEEFKDFAMDFIDNYLLNRRR